MNRTIWAILTVALIAGMANAGPLLWRGATTIPAGKMIFMSCFSYSVTSRSWNWMDQGWTDIPDNNQTTVLGAHFMFGYAPVNKWEMMAHIPVMSKSRDTLSTLGIQDIWLKTRYNFIGGKNQPYLTGVAAVRIPASDQEAEIPLDDGTLDFALGMLFQHSMNPFVLHAKAGYWYNMKDDAEIDIGDEIEVIVKCDYIFNKKVSAFLNLTLVETLKSKDADGNSIDNSQKRRFDIIPGVLVKPVKGLSIRPKFMYPLEMICRGGSNYSWKLGLDLWFVP